MLFRSADYVVNYAIHEADNQGEITKRPDSALFDLKYKGMTTKQIFDSLMQDAKQNGSGQGGEDSEGGHDSHDWEGADSLSDEEKKEVAKQIDQALRQGEIIRGKMQGNKNRSVSEILEPKVDWREQLREFVNATCKNKDRTSWKRPHKQIGRAHV